MSISIRNILEKEPIRATAPCRIDAGGTWDIKAMALPMERIQPVTVNMALDLRTEVSLLPFNEGRVKILSEGFPEGEECGHERMPFDSSFGLFFAAVSHFGFHGLEIRIRSDSPVKSALGGSSTALVALLKALSEAAVSLGDKNKSRAEILHLGYHIEDAVSPGKCGIQDQAAAVFGGVHQWVWRYGNRGAPYERKTLLDRGDLKSLTRRLLVAFSGTSHVSSRINRLWIDDFLSGKTRSGWIASNEIVRQFAEALRRKNWSGAATLLRQETAIRREITPEALIPITEALIDRAEAMGCGARFTGAGAGGSVWAIGDEPDIARLKESWTAMLAQVQGGGILGCSVDPRGVE